MNRLATMHSITDERLQYHVNTCSRSNWWSANGINNVPML